MQSKMMINILALFALIVLTTFGAVTIIDFNGPELENKTKLDNRKLLLENSESIDQTLALRASLVELNEENETLQKTIVENMKIQGELVESLVDLENKKVLVVAELDLLEIKRLELNKTVLKLNEAIQEEKNLQTTKLKLESNEINNHNELLSEFNDLELKHKNLEKEIIFLKKDRDQSISKLNSSLIKFKGEFDQIKRASAATEDALRKDVSKLMQRLQRITLENEKNLNELTVQKAVNLKQLEQKKVVGKLATKTEMEIENLQNFKSNFQQLNGLRVIVSGNMIYDEAKSQIVFKADNSIGIPIFQDDFTGSIAGKCGLPIDKEVQNRCSATIIAEFVVENSGLFLRGKEIVEILRK